VWTVSDHGARVECTELLAARSNVYLQAPSYGLMGKTEMSAGMSPEVPDLRAVHIQRLTDGELFYIIKNGVRFTALPAWDMSDQHDWR